MAVRERESGDRSGPGGSDRHCVVSEELLRVPNALRLLPHALTPVIDAEGSADFPPSPAAVRGPDCGRCGPPQVALAGARVVTYPMQNASLSFSPGQYTGGMMGAGGTLCHHG